MACLELMSSDRLTLTRPRETLQLSCVTRLRGLPVWPDKLALLCGQIDQKRQATRASRQRGHAGWIVNPKACQRLD